MAARSYGTENVIGHASHEQLGVEGCRNLAFVSGHFGIEFAKPLMAGRFSFTFLRDPIERLLSLYAFSAGRPPGESPFYDTAREQGLEAFLRQAFFAEEVYRGMFWHHQTWQLAYGRNADLAGKPALGVDDMDPQKMLSLAKQNLDAFDYVGLVDTFAEDARKIFEFLGCSGDHTVPIANVSTNRIDRRELPPSAMRLLKKISGVDQELYWYAWRRRGLFKYARRRFDWNSAASSAIERCS